MFIFPGACVATALGKGFLAIRKAGHLCVETQSQSYSDYTGREKTMELRVDVLQPGLRVLLVDQWIETGGTMKAAIQMIERLGATVVGQSALQHCNLPLFPELLRSNIDPHLVSAAGVAAVAIENTDGGKWIKENYKFSHCIPEELQNQIDQKYLDSFKAFTQVNYVRNNSNCDLKKT